VETAIVLVRCEPNAVAGVGPALAAVDGIAEVYSVAGDFDIAAILRTTDHEAIAAIITERVLPLEGIRETRTLIAFRQYDAGDIRF
jgi:DNA-binding Lrp family transcriptional regulator